ncbi:hypothetical protein D3C86_1577140 [compost metagenome]
MPKAEATTAITAKVTPSTACRPNPAPMTSPPDRTATPITPMPAPSQAAGAAFCFEATRNRIRLMKARAAKITATTAEAIFSSEA